MEYSVFGYCIGRDTLQHICAQIRVEAILYTLVREPALAVPCPFQDAYHFTYNNNTGGFCNSPMSYVQSCAGDAKFNFKFRRCEEAAYTANKAMNLECLATWKDGSSLFMYGDFRDDGGTAMADKDLTYRCFMYQVFGTVVYLSMSADATCRGLRTPRDGPLVMEFTKDQFGWPQPRCSLPQWFSAETWEDLSARNTYRPQPDGQILDVYGLKHRLPDIGSAEHRRRMHSPGHMELARSRSAYRCLRVQLQNKTKTSVTALTFASHDCISNFQCLRLVRHHKNIVEIHLGKSVQFDTDLCTENHFINATKHLLLPKGLPPQPCPHHGRHRVTSSSPKCQLHLHVGCNRSSDVTVHSSCVAQPVGNLECLQTWKEHHKTFLIARRTDGKHKSSNCFMFRPGLSADTVEMSTARRCNLGTKHVFHHPVNYVFSAKPGKCPPLRTIRKDFAREDRLAQDELSQDDLRSPLVDTGYTHAQDARAVPPEPRSRAHRHRQSVLFAFAIAAWTVR